MELKVLKYLIEKIIMRIESEPGDVYDPQYQKAVEESYNEVIVLHIKIIENLEDKMEKIEFYK